MIIGHQKILEYFTKALKYDKLSHAYLFVGPANVGKTTVARWLVEKLLTKDENFWSRPNPDVQVVLKGEDKKEIFIDQIRKLREFIQQKPLLETHKIIIIENIEDMSHAAVNALLKTLEEPPGDSLIILTSKNLHAVLDTVISRCQLIKFRQVPTKEIAKHLKSHKADEAETLATLAQGRPGLALQWAESLDDYKNIVKQADIFISLISAEIDLKFSYVEQLLPKGSDMVRQVQVVRKSLELWRVLIRDITLLKVGLFDKIVYSNLLKSLEAKAQQLSLKQLASWQRETDETMDLLQKNVNPRLALENLLLKF